MNTASARRPLNRCSTGFWTTNWYIDRCSDVRSCTSIDAGGRQWFALQERDPNEYRLGAQAAQPVLDRFLDDELARHSLDGSALALVGFSQGAMMTFNAACAARLRQRP